VIADIAFLHCNHVPRCVSSVDKRFDYHTVQFMTAGAVELWYGESRTVLEGCYLWPAMPGPHIRFGRAPGCAAWDHRYVAFTGTGVHRLADPGRLLSEPLAVPSARADRVCRVMDDLIEAASDPGELQRMKASTILQRLLLEAAEIRGSTDPAGTSWLEPIVATLERTGGRPDYRRVAAEAGMSLPTLRRRFHAATGVPIHEYHLRSRLAEARRLLAETPLAIKEIAARLGYSDVFYFTRQFSGKTGVSPAVYRASVQSTAARPGKPESS